MDHKEYERMCSLIQEIRLKLNILETRLNLSFSVFPTIEQRLAENRQRALDKYKREYASQHGRINEDVYNNGEDEID